MNICGYNPESITEGDGMRAVVYVSGCLHRCLGCFNPQSHAFDAGRPFTLDLQREIIEEIAANPLLDGVTLCGGDPFFSAADCTEFLRQFRAACPDKTIWAYTGFVYEDLRRNPVMADMADLCDVIVDGPFIADLRDTSLPFRGSRNQRIIRVK